MIASSLFVTLLNRRANALLLALLSAAACRLTAQQQPPAANVWCLPADSGGARVWGTVYDSVSREPLALLVMQLRPINESGAPIHDGWWARTDSLGHFCIRGVFIHPGRYRLTATHRPVLGRHRPAPIHRDFNVESSADTAVALPYRSFSALDSLATERIRDSLIAVIRDHRQQWRSRRPARYYYEAQPNCLCPSPSVTVVVKGDSAIGTLDPRTGAERFGHSADSLMTIDGLFDWLESDVRNPDNNLWYITWDTRYGYPSRWEAGRDVIIIDAYGGATITRFQPAPR